MNCATQIEADGNGLVTQLGRRARRRAGEVTAAYANGAERPIGGYLALLATYGTVVAGLSGVVYRRGRRLPDRPSPADVALIAVATHKVSRMITKDSVLASVRAPFTVYREPAGAGEVNEDVRGQGIRHAIGELATCPFCVAQWIATGFVFGLLLAPRATRQVASVFCVVAASDALQFAYAKLESAGH